MGKLLPRPSIDLKPEGINFSLSALLKKSGRIHFFAKFLNKYVPFFEAVKK